MPLFRRAIPFLLAAALAIEARAGVVSPAGPVFAPPADAWAGPLGVVFADPAVSALLPPGMSSPSLTPEALRRAAPLVQSLAQGLSITPATLSDMDPAQRKAAVELAVEEAKEAVRTKAYELAETARALSKPERVMDKEGRAELYAAVSRLMEMREYYGPWLDDDGRAAVETGYASVSARAWEVRTSLLEQNAAALVERRPAQASAPAAPVYVLKPGGTVVKLREEMEKSKSGWGQNDLDALYTGYGFVLRQGGKHRMYTHPVFSQLRQSVSRQNDLPPGYAQSALKLIAELERLSAARTKTAAAPGTGPPATLTLADLSILLSPPKVKAAKPKTSVEPVRSRAPPVALISSALSPATPRIVETKPEPPPATQTPLPRTWVETMLDRIGVGIATGLGLGTPQVATGFDRFGVAQSDAARQAAINVIQEAVDAFVRRAESIQSLAGSPDAKALVHVQAMKGDLLPGTWSKPYPARLGVFPPGLDIAALDSARAEGLEYAGASSAYGADVAPHPVKLIVDYSVSSLPTRAMAREASWELGQAIGALRKAIFQEYGVHIVLAQHDSSDKSFSLPRDAIVGDGLREHFKIVKTLVEVNGRTQITSRSFQEVAHDLGYDDSEMSALAGKDVLTVGEGGSDFGKTLESRGADVTAADWWYGMTATQIDRYLRIDNGRSRRLMSGRETLSNLPRRRMVGRLPHLPAADASFDETVANQLIYWLDDTPNLAAASLRDLIRVTRPGGRVRIGQVNTALYERFANILAAERPDAKLRYGKRGNNVLVIDLPASSRLPAKNGPS